MNIPWLPLGAGLSFLAALSACAASGVSPEASPSPSTTAEAGSEAGEGEDAGTTSPPGDARGDARPSNDDTSAEAGDGSQAAPPVEKAVSPSGLAASSEASETPCKPSLAPPLLDDVGAPLAQTEDKPGTESAWFQDNARALFTAIVEDDVEGAMPFFFPKVAYEQVKHIVDPGRDWETRLVAAYQKDIHKYHQALGKFRSEATFQEVRVADSLAKWVKPGVEVNKVGYYRVMRSVLVYRDHAQRSRELGIMTMISWRGEWYVVHLAPFK